MKILELDIPIFLKHIIFLSFKPLYAQGYTEQNQRMTKNQRYPMLIIIAVGFNFSIHLSENEDEVS